MAVQWYSVFENALRIAPVIAVWATVEEFVGRVPTRAELSAARRAANRYASISGTQVVRVATPFGDRGIVRTVLLLARGDADLGDVERLRDVAARRPRRLHQGQGTRNVSQRAESLVAALTRSAKTARLLSVGQLDPRHAAVLARDLDVLLADLQQLQRRLRLQSKA